MIRKIESLTIYGIFPNPDLNLNSLMELPDQNPQLPRRKFSRVSKLPLKIDMTPMVDLGFLLITFFVFTTALGQLTALSLVMPDDSGKPMPTKESGALVLIPAGDGKLFFYEGRMTNQPLSNVSMSRLRQVIMDKKHRSGSENLFVIIKPDASVSYGAVVDILDEMIICGIGRYAIVDMEEDEKLRLARAVLN